MRGTVKLWNVNKRKGTERLRVEKHMAASTFKTSWGELPEYVVATILSYLNVKDRLNAAQVCKLWSLAAQHPIVWTSMTFNITKEEEAPDYQELTFLAQQYGSFFREIEIKVNQTIRKNREIACSIIDELASTEDRRLSSVKISFTGENPLFYAGTEFINAMRKLFGANPEVLSRQCSNITSVDLSGLSVPFDDNIINVLAIHHSKSLQSLKIMNNLLVNRVSPTCLICMAELCRKLRHLEVYYSSMSDDALIALAEEDRTPIESLTLSCKAETRFTLPLTGEAWQQLVAKSPNISITFLFDHTLALDSMSKFLTWGIPVKNLSIENYAEMNDHLLRVSRLYRRSLESLVITTDNSKYSEDIGTALVQVVTKCTKLKKLMVYTRLTKEVVEEIYKILPNLRNQGCSHLRFPVA